MALFVALALLILCRGPAVSLLAAPEGEKGKDWVWSGYTYKGFQGGVPGFTGKQASIRKSVKPKANTIFPKDKTGGDTS